MTNVLGPYDQEDFKVMSQLKKRINWFRSQGTNNYDNSIEKDTAILKLFIQGKVA